MDALSPFRDRRVKVTEMMLNCRYSVGSMYLVFTVMYTGLFKQCPCKTCDRTEIPVLYIIHFEIRFNPFRLQDIYKRGILRCILLFFRVRFFTEMAKYSRV